MKSRASQKRDALPGVEVRRVGERPAELGADAGDERPPVGLAAHDRRVHLAPDAEHVGAGGLGLARVRQHVALVAAEPPPPVRLAAHRDPVVLEVLSLCHLRFDPGHEGAARLPVGAAEDPPLLLRRLVSPHLEVGLHHHPKPGRVGVPHERAQVAEAEVAVRPGEDGLVEPALERVPGVDRDPGDAQGSEAAEGRLARVRPALAHPPGDAAPEAGRERRASAAGGLCRVPEAREPPGRRRASGATSARARPEAARTSAEEASSGRAPERVEATPARRRRRAPCAASKAARSSGWASASTSAGSASARRALRHGARGATPRAARRPRRGSPAGAGPRRRTTDRPGRPARAGPRVRRAGARPSGVPSAPTAGPGRP